MSERDVRLFLHDMLEAIEKTTRYLSGLTSFCLSRNEAKRASVDRCWTRRGD
jgi:uncharacterized protein with HEPN domain